MGHDTPKGTCDFSSGGGYCKQPAVESCRCQLRCTREYCEEHRWTELDTDGLCICCVRGGTCAADGSPYGVTPRGPWKARTKSTQSSNPAGELSDNRVHFTCSKCHKKLSAPMQSAGLQGKCPACGSPVNIPSPTGPGPLAAGAESPPSQIEFVYQLDRERKCFVANEPQHQFAVEAPTMEALRATIREKVQQRFGQNIRMRVILKDSVMGAVQAIISIGGLV